MAVAINTPGTTTGVTGELSEQHVVGEKMSSGVGWVACVEAVVLVPHVPGRGGG